MPQRQETGEMQHFLRSVLEHLDQKWPALPMETENEIRAKESILEKTREYLIKRVPHQEIRAVLPSMNIKDMDLFITMAHCEAGEEIDENSEESVGEQISETRYVIHLAFGHEEESKKVTTDVCTYRQLLLTDLIKIPHEAAMEIIESLGDTDRFVLAHLLTTDMIKESDEFMYLWKKENDEIEGNGDIEIEMNSLCDEDVMEDLEYIEEEEIEVSAQSSHDYEQLRILHMQIIGEQL